MTNVLISDASLLNIFHAPESPSAFFPRKYAVVFGYPGVAVSSTYTIHAPSLKVAKEFAREYEARMTRATLQSVVYQGLAKW